MRRFAFVLALLAWCGAAFAQGGMAPGPGTVHSTGGGSASFTFGSSGGNTGAQGTSPFVTAAQTFNTGASDLAIVAVNNANDFASGVLTSVVVNSVTLTCVQGTNNASEQGWLCYGVTGSLTTATVTFNFTGTLLASFATGKVVTTTTTPYSTGNSTAGQAGASTPMAVAATTGSGGIPSSGVGLCMSGDFFATGRTWSSVTPNQADIINNNAAGNGQNFAFGYSTTVGASSGVTFNETTSAGIFPAWACASWSP